MCNTCFAVCQTGRTPTMRHLPRTHYVQIPWLKERFAESDLKLVYEPSAKQAADIYTKGFDNALKWEHASMNIGIIDKVSIRNGDSIPW